MCQMCIFGFDDDGNLCTNHASVCMDVHDAFLAVSQEVKLGEVSYLVSRCTTLSTRFSMFLLEVKGNLLQRHLNHSISKRKTLTNLIIGVRVYDIECKNPTVFGGGQHSLWVKIGQVVINLVKGSLERFDVWYIDAPH